MKDFTAILFENSKMPYFDRKFLGFGLSFHELVTCKIFFLKWKFRYATEMSRELFSWNSCSLYFVSHYEALDSLICILSASRRS